MTPLLLVVLALGQPDAAFARGVDARDDAKAARPHFIEAAKGYDAEWQAGRRSPALATNRSRAHALAGDLPGAILAAREGLRETPSDAELIRQLETLRDAVPYPQGVRPDRPGGARTRLSPWDVFAVAKLGGWLGRTCDGPPGWGSIWRGDQRLADLMPGIELAETMPRRTRPKPARCG